LLQIGIWLLTPLAAWAVSFLGGWLGALVGRNLSSPAAALALVAGGSVAGALVGGLGWISLVRRLLSRWAGPQLERCKAGDRFPIPDPWERYWGKKKSPLEVYPAVSDLLAEIATVMPEVRGRRVLEVGAGTGREGHTLAARGAYVVLVDFSAAALKLSRKLSPGPRLVRADATRLPFRDGSFDLVYHQGLMEHFRDPLPLLRENNRVLCTGGILLVDVPQAFHIYTLVKHTLMVLGRWFAGWETQYFPRGLERIVESAGFRCERRYGYWMEPGLWYRSARQVLKALGIRLPLFPSFGPLRGVYSRLRRGLRRLQRRQWSHYLTLTVGVVARKE
jgi:SAM-dependent methyltransferase